MSDKTFLVDTSKCQGCRACQVACKNWNGLPGEKTEFFAGPELTNPGELSDITWNHVKFFPVDRTNKLRPLWTIMHKKCYHCSEPNCLAVCPEKAIYKFDGWVIIDENKCIGCGACENACIYKVPKVAAKTHVNDVGQKIVMKDKSHKCNACTLNVREVPACVNTCPSAALLFGNRHKMIKIANDRVKEIKKDFPNASIYGLNEFGGLRVITVLKDKPEKYGLPTDVKAIDITKLEAVKDIYGLLSMFTFGIPSLKRTAYKMAKTMGSSKEV
jgi:formate dehydrogenase iron-sulfur subunit